MDFNIIGTSVCNYCIAIMVHMSHIYGLSYGLINVLLFIVLGPLSTLVFMAASIVSKFKSRVCRVASIILDVIGILIILSVCIPIAYAFLTMPK